MNNFLFRFVSSNIPGKGMKKPEYEKKPQELRAFLDTRMKKVAHELKYLKPPGKKEVFIWHNPTHHVNSKKPKLINEK